MPMEIDSLKASPAVQAMHPSARSGYVWLLLDAWQTDDCTIPNDPIDLADKSGLGDELWASYGLRILRKFEQINGSNRLRNLPQYERWKAAKAVYEKNRSNAERTNYIRSALEGNTNSGTLASRSVSLSENLPLQPPLITETETITGTEKQEQQQKQKPSRAKSTSVKKGEKVPDERHQACKLAIQEYWNSKNPEIEVPWDGSEGKALGMFLSANPKLTYVGVGRLLAHRENSEVNHSDRPSRWIRSLTSFNQGPIDRFGHPLGLNGGKHAAISQGRGQKNVGVLEEFINDTERRSDANQNGNIPAGDHRQSDTETLHGVSGGSRPQSLPSSDAEPLDF